MADTNITMTTAGGVRLETEGTYVDTDIVVAPDSTSQANLTSENIKEGVSILGVTGTLSAEAGADGKTPVLTQSTINFIPSTTQNGQFTIGAEVEVGDPIIIACTGSGTYEGRTWMVVGDVMSFASTSHVAGVDVTGVTETTGEQGPQGEQGATGSPGAAGADGEDGEPPVIATQDSYSGVPVTGTSQQYTLDTWSRVPASGDDIMIMVAGQAGTASADRTFISVGTVVSATSQSPKYSVTVNVVGVQETTGQAGAAGVGVPSGGTTGQVLKKASNTNYATEWGDVDGGIQNNELIERVSGAPDPSESTPDFIEYSGGTYYKQSFFNENPQIKTLSATTAATQGMASGTVGEKIYLFGGIWNGVGVNTIQVFDSTTNLRSTLPETLANADSGISAGTVGTKIYLFGGVRGTTYRNIIQEFDTETETIRTLTPLLPSNQAYSGIGVVGSDIYIFGGINSTNSYLKTIMVFNTEAQTITSLSTALPSGRAGMATATLGTKIYLFGGEGAGPSVTDEILVFDTEAKTIQELNAVLPAPTRYSSAGVIDGKIYLFGGYAGSPSGEASADIQIFNPANEEIQTLEVSLPTGAYRIACSVVGTSAYLFGGVSSSGNISTINQFTAGAHDYQYIKMLDSSDLPGGGVGNYKITIADLSNITSEEAIAALQTLTAWIEAGSPANSTPMIHVDPGNGIDDEFYPVIKMWNDDGYLKGQISIGVLEMTITGQNATFIDQPLLSSDTAGQSAFSTVSNIVTTTADSPDASSLPEGTLVIKIAS